MAFVDWTDSFSVNVAEIDKQHQGLVGMLNDFYDAVMAKAGDEAISKLIDGMANYTVTHFQTEEKYFDKFNYPETAAHKKEHADFVEKVQEVQAKLKSGRMVVPLEISNFLKTWLSKHILGSDKKYTKCFNDNGLK